MVKVPLQFGKVKTKYIHKQSTSTMVSPTLFALNLKNGVEISFPESFKNLSFIRKIWLNEEYLATAPSVSYFDGINK